jgi:hypothetical protein
MQEGKEKEEEDNYDQLFATLAAEQSARGFDEDLLAQFEMAPAVAASKLSKGGAKEGQDQLMDILNGDPPESKFDTSEGKAGDSQNMNVA